MIDNVTEEQFDCLLRIADRSGQIMLTNMPFSLAAPLVKSGLVDIENARYVVRQEGLDLIRKRQEMDDERDFNP